MAHLGLSLNSQDAAPSVGRARRGGAKAQAPVISDSACEAFIGALVNAFEEKPAAFLAQRGRIALDVADDRSVTVRFGDSKAPLEWGADTEAELRLVTRQAVLRQILDGTVDAEAELTSGALRLEGDIELLVPLFQLLERGRSMLSVRMGR